MVVLKKEHCDKGYNRLVNITIANAKINIGKKNCIVLGDYTTDFYNARYSNNSFACRRAKGNAAEYLNYFSRVSDK